MPAWTPLCGRRHAAKPLRRHRDDHGRRWRRARAVDHPPGCNPGARRAPAADRRRSHDCAPGVERPAARASRDSTGEGCGRASELSHGALRRAPTTRPTDGYRNDGRLVPHRRARRPSGGRGSRRADRPHARADDAALRSSSASDGPDRVGPHVQRGRACGDRVPSVAPRDVGIVHSGVAPVGLHVHKCVALTRAVLAGHETPVDRRALEVRIDALCRPAAAERVPGTGHAPKGV